MLEAHPEGAAEERFRFECAGGAVAVTTARDRLTPWGGAEAWSHYLEKLGVIADLARRFPLARIIPNATRVADVLQAFMFNCLMGGRRFAHAWGVQDDQALVVILGMHKVRLCGEDAFYRMKKKVPRQQARTCWPGASATFTPRCPRRLSPDWDSTVNTRYGRQEDVTRGYNPHKPGRGSHHPLLCVVAGTRLALHLEWRPGNEVSAGHWVEAMEWVWSHPDVPSRLQLNRGDIGFAQEKIMAWHERADVPRPCYLFKLKMTANVRCAIVKAPCPEWDGRPRVGLKQYAETRVKLEGWSCERRIILTRKLKPANRSPHDVFWGADQEEFCAYVTNLEPHQATPAQVVLTYRKRGDAENVFDELKNQWGFDGFCSGKGVVSETAARLLLLTYNLWSLFVRVLKEEGCHREAITSRVDLLVMPAKLVESGRQKPLRAFQMKL